MSGRHGTGKGRTTLAKVIDQAVARCAEGGARNCRLYALGDTVVHDRSQRETDTIAAEYAHRVVGARVEGVFKFYLGDHDFKALAFDPMSGRHGTGQGQTTLAKAIDEAMARCAGGGTRSCQLYALGDSVVRDRSQREIDTIAAEYVQKVVRVRLEEAFKFYLGDHDFKALAFDPMSGRHSTGHGQTTPAKAVDEATARCAEGGAQSCELYAVGDIVVRGLPKEEVDAVIERYRQEVAASSSETKH